MTLDDKPCPGRHWTSRIDKNVTKICAPLLEDQRQTIDKLEMSWDFLEFGLKDPNRRFINYKGHSKVYAPNPGKFLSFTIHFKNLTQLGVFIAVIFAAFAKVFISFCHFLLTGCCFVFCSL